MKLRSLLLSVALVAATSSPSRARADEPAAAPSASPASPISPTAPAPANPLGRVPALVTGGLAVVALGVGTVYGILAWQDHESFQSAPTTALANRGEAEGLTADMCLGGAATLAVAAVVMYFTHEEASAAQPASESAPRVSLAPFASPHGGGAAAVVRF
ncbi:MAG: hypothetical protein ACLQVI_33350 [Polyangiaceae bacterium]